MKSSQRQVGPDYNNQLTYSPSGFTARNATLQALVAEAYGVQRGQVFGKAWIDRSEYDIDARATGGATREQRSAMLRGLLGERFHLKQHMENRDMRVYELVPAKSGVRIRPGAGKANPGRGLHFHGDMREFADFLAVQVSIPAANDPTAPAIAGGPPVPVLDKTGLSGIYDFTVDVRPELGTDGFVVWQRALQEQVGLNIQNRKGPVSVRIIDDALKVPSAN